MNPKQTFLVKKIGKSLPKKTPQLSQRDQYKNSMNKAQANGGSNGIGVGN